MPRAVGIDIPENKKMGISLTYIEGIGRSLAKKVLDSAKIPTDLRAKDLSDAQAAAIQEAILKMRIPVEGELRRIVTQNIRRLKDIACYRGIRHLKNLPVRGQNTKTNARTKRGKRKTIGGMKRVLEKT